MNQFDLRNKTNAETSQKLMTNISTTAETHDQHVEGLAVKIKTRSRQPTPLYGSNPAYIYLIREGIHFSEVTLPETTAQIVELFTPGCIVPSHTLPNASEPQLTCASDTGLIWRIQRADLHAALAQNPGFLESVNRRLDQQAGRMRLHAAMLSSLDSEQKLIALLTELAIRTGQKTPTGTVFELPLRRTDIATYLGLNPDTVSRLLSRLRTAGLISSIGTHRNRLLSEGDMLQSQCALLEIIEELEQPLSVPPTDQPELAKSSI